MIPDLTHYETWVPFLAGVLIPFLVMLLTKYHAQAWVKSLVAVVLLALTAASTYLLDTGHSHTWRGTLTAFVIALFSAGTSRYTVTGGADVKLGNAGPLKNFGLGRGTPPPLDTSEWPPGVK